MNAPAPIARMISDLVREMRKLADVPETDFGDMPPLPAPQAPVQGEVPMPEPVGWQQRHLCTDEGPSIWQFCSGSDAAILAKRADYELRRVYVIGDARALAAVREQLSDAGIVAAARALNKLHAETCGVDAHDSWTHYSDDFKADARVVLTAAAQAQPPAGWVCSKCGTDRTKAACPHGHHAALTGQCPMTGTAQAQQEGGRWT